MARVWWEARDYEVVDTPTEPRPLAGAHDFAVSFGGDGTMLRTLQLALPGQTPVIGINLGRMGYLAEVEPAGMEAAFEALIAGDFKVEERMALDVAIQRAVQDVFATFPPRSAATDEPAANPLAGSWPR